MARKSAVPTEDNASDSAWKGRNCEAVIRFAPGVSIDRFCDNFIFGEKPAKPGARRPVRGWITEYRRQPFSKDENDEAENIVDAICDYLARLVVRGIFDPAKATLRIMLEIPPRTLPRNSTSGHLHPISRSAFSPNSIGVRLFNRCSESSTANSSLAVSVSLT